MPKTDFPSPINRLNPIPLIIIEPMLKTKQVAGSVQSRDSSSLGLKSTKIPYSDKPYPLGTDGTKARGSGFSICLLGDGPTIWILVGFTCKNLRMDYGSGRISGKVGFGPDRTSGLTFGNITKQVGYISRRLAGKHTSSTSLPEPTSRSIFIPRFTGLSALLDP